MTETKQSELMGDIWGGLTAAIVALPLALAFGVAAFAPLGAEYASTGALVGLLGSIYTGFAAAKFGGTPAQITGPTGPMTVVSTAFIAQIVTVHGANLPVIAILMALGIVIGGAVQILIGLSGGGKVVKYMPYPVVAGFMNGIAIIIFIGQIKPALGIRGSWSEFDVSVGWVPMLVAIGTVVAILVSRKISKAVPGALVGLVAGIIIYMALAASGLAPFTSTGNPLLIGTVPNPFASWEQMQRLMPVFQFGALENLGFSDFKMAFTAGLALAVLGSIDSLLTSLIADSVTHTRHDSRKELIGQGIGNILSGLGGGLAGAGATVRTLVNVRAGGRTSRSGMLHSTVIFLVVMVFGAPAGWIPLAALSGILFYTAVTMVDYYSLRLIKRRNVRSEFFIMIIVTAVTVMVDLMVAVGVGCAIAAILFITQQIKQPVVHRRERGNEIFSRRVRSSAKETAILKKFGHRTLSYELKGSLFFGTTDALISEVEADIESADKFIFDFSRVKDIDLSGVKILLSIIERLHSKNRRVFFSGLLKFEEASALSIREMLRDMGVIAEVGEENIYEDHDLAMEAAEEMLLHEHHEGYTEGQPALTLLDFESFQNLESDEVEEFKMLLQEKKLKAGDYLFAKGEAVDSFVLVRKGELNVFKQGKDKDIRIATVSPGAMLGWRALMQDEQRITGGIRAETDVEVYLIPKEALAKLEKEHPTALLHFHRELLRNAVERMQILTSELILLEER
ncbi:MAG: SLC26A/SulP transporter family protein [Proteobacteria bacterium]|nr:SLC26A/SulP transporter family protein [Pseudomonadota bacterium]